MITRTTFVVFVLSVGLSGLACRTGQPVVSPEEGRLSTAEHLWLPAEAKVAFSKLAPEIKRPVDLPDALKLPARAYPIVQKARGYIAEGKYAQAVRLLERARGFAPDSPVIHRELGLAYSALGDTARARAHLERSVQKAPDDVRVQVLLAGYDLAAGKTDSAMIRLRRALLCSNATDTNPYTVKALFYLASLLERQGYWTAALDCYRRVGKIIEHNEDVLLKRPELRSLITRPERLILARGRLLVKLGKFSQAAGLLERAYRLDKSNPEAGSLAVKALIKAEKFDQAKDIVMEMLAEAPSRSVAVCAAVQWCLATKDGSSAIKILEDYSASGNRPDTALVVAMAKAAAKLGAKDQAVGIISRYIKEVPEAPFVLSSLAELEVQVGRPCAAAKYFAVLLRSPRFDVGRVRRGIIKMVHKGVGKDFANKLAAEARLKVGNAKVAELCVSAIIYDAIGMPGEAVRLLKGVVHDQPKFLPAYEILEEIYVRQGRYASLDELIGQIDRVAKDSYFRFYLIGKSQLERGKTDDAIGNLHQARQRSGLYVPALLALGRAYAGKGDFSNAVKYLQLALALSPDDEDVASVLMDLYLSRGRYHEAERLVQRYMQSSCESISAHLLYFRYCLARSWIYQARCILQQMLEEAPGDVEVRLAQLDLLLPHPIGPVRVPKKILAPVMKKVEEILRIDPCNIKAGLLYAEMLVNQGQYGKSADVLRDLWRGRPYDATIVSAYLDSLVKAKRKKELLSVVNKISHTKSLNRTLGVMLIDNLINAECFERAESLLERWLSTPTSREDLIVMRLEALKLYESAGLYEKAHGLLDQWISSLRSSGYDSSTTKKLISLLRAEKLKIYGKTGRFAKAIAYAKQWAQDTPGDNQPQDMIVGILMSAKQYDRAEKLVEQWIGSAGGKRRGILRTVKIMLLARQGRFAKLIEFGRDCLAKEPRLADDYYYTMVSVLAEQKRYDDALKVARDWVKYHEKRTSDGKKSEGLFNAETAVVDVLVRAGRNRQALIEAKRFVKRHPGKVEPLKLVKYVLTEMGKTDKAEEVAKQIYQLKPDDVGVNNDLGYTWADRGVNLDKAESMILKALSARPEDVAILDSYGWVLYKKGEFTKAKRVFDRIMSSGEQEIVPVILDHAGDTFWRLGLKIHAVQLWIMAVEKARKERRKDKETRRILSITPGKISAAIRGSEPRVARLGKGVSISMVQLLK